MIVINASGNASEVFQKLKTSSHQASLAIEQTKRAIKDTLSSVNTSITNNANKAINGLKEQVKGLGLESKKTSSSINGLVGSLGGLVIAKDLVSTFSTLQQQLLDIQKTTGYTKKELEEFRREITEISIANRGMELSSLYEISAIAGQLGIKGKEDVKKFTTEIKKLVSTSSLSASEAGEGFAKLSNSLNEPIANITKLASTFTILASSTTASEKDLLDYVQRLAGVGTTAGLTTPQIAGIGATLKDVGLSAELSGTAVSQLLMKMLTESKDISRVMGLDFADFSKTMNDKPIHALEVFLKKLQSLDKVARIQALKDLKLSGSGLSSTLLKLASNTDKLHQNILTANKGYREATALQDEFNISSQSLKAKQEQLTSAYKDLSYEIGVVLEPTLIGVIDTLVPMIQVIKDNKEEIIATTKVIGGMALAWKTLNIVFKASPFGRVVAGLSAIATGAVYATSKINQMREASAKAKEQQRIDREKLASGKYVSDGFNNVVSVESVNQKKYNDALKASIALKKSIEIVSKNANLTEKQKLQTLIFNGNELNKQLKIIKELEKYKSKEVKEKVTPTIKNVKPISNAQSKEILSIQKLKERLAKEDSDRQKRAIQREANARKREIQREANARKRETEREANARKRELKDKLADAKRVQDRKIADIEQAKQREIEANKSVEEQRQREFKQIRDEFKLKLEVVGLTDYQKQLNELNKSVEFWRKAGVEEAQIRKVYIDEVSRIASSNVEKEARKTSELVKQKQMEEGKTKEVKEQQDTLSSSLKDIGKTLTKDILKNFSQGQSISDAIYNATSDGQVNDLLTSSNDPTLQAIGYTGQLLSGILSSSEELVVDINANNKSLVKSFSTLDKVANPQLAFIREIARNTDEMKRSLGDASHQALLYGDSINGDGSINGLFGNSTDTFLGSLATGVGSAVYNSRTDIKDYGLQFQDQSLSSFLENPQIQSYLQTRETDSYLLGVITSSSDNTSYSELDPKISNAIRDTVANGVANIEAQANSLNIGLDNAIASIRIDPNKLRIKGKTEDEINQLLQGEIGAILDDVSNEAVKSLEDFRGTGEESYALLTRVSVQYADAKETLRREGIDYIQSIQDIENKKNNVYDETIRASIKNNETLSNTITDIGEIVSDFYGTGDEMLSLYVVLREAQDGLRLLRGNSNDSFTTELNAATFGDSTELIQLQASAYQTFIEDAKKEADNVKRLTDIFGQGNIPQTREAYLSLLETLDLNTQSGAELYIQYLQNQDSVLSYITSLEEEEKLREENTQATIDAYKDIASGIVDMYQTNKDALLDFNAQVRGSMLQLSQTDNTQAQNTTLDKIEYNRIAQRIRSLSSADIVDIEELKKEQTNLNDVTNRLGAIGNSQLNEALLKDLNTLLISSDKIDYQAEQSALLKKMTDLLKELGNGDLSREKILTDLVDEIKQYDKDKLDILNTLISRTA